MKQWQILLLPFSWFYAGVIRLRNFLYDAGVFTVKRVPVPIISVGNLTTGGTGKTPFVEYVARYMLSKNKKVAVISRGYKRSTHGLQIVSDGINIQGTAETMGDEPMQMARKLSGAVVVVDEQRIRAAKYVVESFDVDAIILDDGFQHRKLGRDLDIVMMNGMSALAKMPMLPAGFRREPLSALRRAHMLAHATSLEVETNTSSIININVSFQPMRCVRIGVDETLVLSELKGKRALAFCGIGTPEGFRGTLESLGVRISELLMYSDHHMFTDADIDNIDRVWRDLKPQILLTTEKDAVRLMSCARRTVLEAHPFYYIELEASIETGKERFHGLLDELLERTT